MESSPDTLDNIPSLCQFNPCLIGFQYSVIKDIRLNFDYRMGVHEVLLSGSVGSAKSLLMAHLAVTHCLAWPNACVLYGRLSMPSLKDTLLQMTIDHLAVDVDYDLNQSRGIIRFANGSKIICHSWSDRKFKKVRSYALSAAFIEELTENDEPDFYKEIRMRLNRVPSVKENIMVSATNPDAPSHWAYEYFFEKKYETRHVYLSTTEGNPFLDSNYIEQLKETLSPKEARRMLYGEWLEISSEVVYYNYESKRNQRKEYTIDYAYPVDLMFDFNIGEGKPLSCAVGQYINNVYLIFDEVIVEGARTADVMDEIINKNWYRSVEHIRVYGDATGRNRDTRSIKSDYDIITKIIRNTFAGVYELKVPLSNPPIRKRHNLVNAMFLNDNKKVRFYCYKNAPTVDKGLRLTKLKKGGNYIEDDSPAYQHVTTAVGYWICKIEKDSMRSTFKQRKI